MIMLEYQKAIFAFFEKFGIPEHHLLAYISTLLISIAPFLLLFLFRVENTPSHKNYLRLALSFASGGLLGDAFIHLIPHAISPHSHHEDEHDHGHDHDDGHAHHHHDHAHSHTHHDRAHSHTHHDHAHSHTHHDHAHSHAHHYHGHDHFQQTMVGLYIVCGIIIFFLMEKFIMFLKDQSGNDHGHSHSHDHPHSNKKKNEQKKVKKAKVSDDESSDNEADNAVLIDGKTNGRVVSGLLNLIADFLHNFTDGLAIGATFATGKSMGAITAVSIFMHEIPHEIGDYAILIQAGYKRSSAISLQLVTALGAFFGTMVGLHFGTFDQATALILPLTAGGFIYIATVTVIPELLEKTNSYLQATLELIALLVGVTMMFFIALYE